MVEAVDVRTVAIKLRDLAKDPEHQPYIARRGVLPALIGFVDGPSSEVRLIAAEALRFLSSHPDNRKIMAAEPNLVETICKHFNNSNDEIFRKIACDILLHLSDHLTEDQKNNTLSLNSVLAFSRVIAGAPTTPVATEKVAHKSSPILANKRNILLSIPKMTTEDQISKLLLSIRGTISYRINLQKKQVVLYTRTPTDRLLSFLENGGFPAQVVKETECDPEDSNKENVDSSAGKQAPGSPKYLGKSPVKESEYKRSLVTTGGADTLEARIARQKSQKQKRQEEASGVSRFLGKLTSVFW
eukprot:GEZU01008837.1.p1 GENE.GEZU01008837.1~~GEZU01008837.1.p1  ORF type:complete len:300 (+),score=81.47 GEZU01008837.1:130-1029(+)